MMGTRLSWTNAVTTHKNSPATGLKLRTESLSVMYVRDGSVDLLILRSTAVWEMAKAMAGIDMHANQDRHRRITCRAKKKVVRETSNEITDVRPWQTCEAGGQDSVSKPIAMAGCHSIIEPIFTTRLEFPGTPSLFFSCFLILQPHLPTQPVPS